MAVIELQGLTKRYGHLLAVDHLSFGVEAGTLTGFLGPNGAGKTTTLRMLLGLVKPDQGEATVKGTWYRDLERPSHVVGAAIEGASFHPGRTARDHLRVRAAAGGVPGGRVDTVLELVGLTRAARQRVGGFSLGQRQRLGLAAALLGDPEVIILDEPANGLDPEGVRWLRGFLRDLADKGRTLLVSSHLLSEVAQIADRVIIMGHGRLVTEASLEELTARARPVVRVRTPRAEQLRLALLSQGVRAGPLDADRLEVSDCTAEAVGLLAARLSIPIFECLTQAADLEDVYFQLTAAAAEEELA